MSGGRGVGVAVQQVGGLEGPEAGLAVQKLRIGLEASGEGDRIRSSASGRGLQPARFEAGRAAQRTVRSGDIRRKALRVSDAVDDISQVLLGAAVARAGQLTHRLPRRATAVADVSERSDAGRARACAPQRFGVRKAQRLERGASGRARAQEIRSAAAAHHGSGLEHVVLDVGQAEDVQLPVAQRQLHRRLHAAEPPELRLGRKEDDRRRQRVGEQFVRLVRMHHVPARRRARRGLWPAAGGHV
eukprot:6846604-Prymnesium_polylepis.1